MSIIEPDVYSYKDVEPIVPYGVAMTNLGLTAWDMIDGYGLLSRGLLWEFYQIWCDQEAYDNLSTSWANGNSAVKTNWTAQASVTTTWADSNSAVTTNWTEQASVSTTWANEGEFNG